MRTIRFAPLGVDVSVLGFGTASLGSRISAADGGRALEEAWDEGVTWYDTAPSYGDGEAESILAPFLRNKRDRLVLVGKVGIARPDRVSGARHALRHLARNIVRQVPQLRSLISGARARSARVPISAAKIEDSVTSSLRSLDTDYLDILALHDPTVAEVGFEEVWTTMRRMIDKGYVRSVSVAGSAASCVAAVAAAPTLDVLQFGSSVFDNSLRMVQAELGAATQRSFITHSALGGGAVRRLERLIAERPSEWSAIAGRWGTDGTLLPNGALLRFNLGINVSGPLLVSMLSGAHVRDNCRIADLPADLVLSDAIGAFVQGEVRALQ